MSAPMPEWASQTEVTDVDGATVEVSITATAQPDDWRVSVQVRGEDGWRTAYLTAEQWRTLAGIEIPEVRAVEGGR